MDPQTTQFGCYTLSDLSNTGSPDFARQRKKHTKSRTGCRNCKTRKIKCDENQPCGNCVKRKQACIFNNFLRGARPVSSHTKDESSSSSNSPQTTVALSSDLSIQSLPPINLQHIELFSHFENSTSKTFVLDPMLWKETVRYLAIRNMFLMHAVLLVSADHLHWLHPHETRHRDAILEFLNQALPCFREALSVSPMNKSDTSDSLISCATLLLQHWWADPDTQEGFDCLVELSAGLKIIALTALSRGDRSRLDWVVYDHPIVTLRWHTEKTTFPAEIEALFIHCLTCTKISKHSHSSFDNCSNATSRLVPVLAAIKLGRRNLEATGLMQDVARYLFTWPLFLSDDFTKIVKGNDERADIVMLYYYAAVSWLGPKRFWWMQRRSTSTCKALLLAIGDKCEECTSWASQLLEEREDGQR